MKKLVFILILISAIVAAGYYFWQKRDIYFFKGEIETKENETEQELVDFEDDVEDSIEEGSETEENLDEQNIDDVTTFEEFEDDCNTECRNILDEEEHDYCLEICGFKERGESSTEDCEKLEDFKRDVCYKNMAIQELDYSYCKKIEDDNVLRESCENRVLEEIIEKDQKAVSD